MLRDMPLRTIPDTDDRRRCSQCTQMGTTGPCRAARSGELIANRNYEPDRKLLRRCEGYRPNRSDPDQRSGLQRWPGLKIIIALEKKTK